MLVRENLNTFKRGMDSRKALDVGMTQVWPDVVKELQDELDVAYKVEGELDEYDDTFYFEISSTNWERAKDGKIDFIAKINTDELSLWGEKTKKKQYGGSESISKMEKIIDISNIKMLADQIRHLKSSLRI